MIYTTLGALDALRGMHPNLDTAIAYAQTHDLQQLPLGKTVIDGEAVFVNVMEAATRPAAGAAFEVHRRYADLQIDLEGREGFGVTLGAAAVTQAYDEPSDFGLTTGETEASGVLGGARCVLFPAGEPHMPTLAVGDAGQRVRKAVFKIEMPCAE